jgi:hypothetical protein
MRQLHGAGLYTWLPLGSAVLTADAAAAAVAAAAVVEHDCDAQPWTFA